MKPENLILVYKNPNNFQYYLNTNVFIVLSFSQVMVGPYYVFRTLLGNRVERIIKDDYRGF